MTRHTPNIGAAASVVVPLVKGAAPAPIRPTHPRIARVAGEFFDADQITPNCDECGLSEYRCLCEPEEWPAMRSTMTLEEAHARIAAAFAPILDLPVTRKADGSAGVRA
ncbi:MAG: hypothetical protein V4661_15865 [Pseudomonadota bacterium]